MNNKLNLSAIFGLMRDSENKHVQKFDKLVHTIKYANRRIVFQTENKMELLVVLNVPNDYDAYDAMALLEDGAAKEAVKRYNKWRRTDEKSKE